MASGNKMWKKTTATSAKTSLIFKQPCHVSNTMDTVAVERKGGRSYFIIIFLYFPVWVPGLRIGLQLGCSLS